MFITDLTKITKLCKDYDGLIYSKQVDDYKRFGVIVIENGKITKLVEKPNKPISKLAQVGLYYLKNGLNFLDIIEYTIKNKITVKGEFYLPTAFQIMIDKGMKLAAPEIEEWLDCGKPETLFQTNRYLLEHGASNKRNNHENSVVIHPVFIGENVIIKNSVIGPYVSIAQNTKIENSIIKDSIIDENAIIKDASLNQSLVGSYVCVNGTSKRLNIGDHSEIFFD
jgi:glucose-1-phosphate thymidylyltransferase